MDERRPDMRVSDRDRLAAVERLRLAMDEGRLDLLEYDDRLAAAYRAVTHADLDRLFTDLPAPGQAPPPAEAAPRRSEPPAVARLPMALKVLWTIWLAVLSINVTVWVLVSLSHVDAVYFWPMWLLVPGAALFTVSAGVLGIRRSR
jgi:hypothetical protein